MAAITASELVFKYSTTAGAAGNANTGTAAGSLGKYVSTTAIPDATLNAMFDDISGAENAASTVDYRGFFIHNTNTLNDLVNAKIYISAETAGGASVALATDNVGSVAKGSASAQEAQIANETTAPSAVSAFSAPTTYAGSTLAIGTSGTIVKDQVAGFWVRRTAANTAALSNDGCTLAITGDTGSL